MATANRQHDASRERSGDGDVGEDALATKVVLLELVDATGPLSVDDLTDRTTLSETTVKSALAALGSAGICEQTQRRGDSDPRFRLEKRSKDDPARWT